MKHCYNHIFSVVGSNNLLVVLLRGGDKRIVCDMILESLNGKSLNCDIDDVMINCLWFTAFSKLMLPTTLHIAVWTRKENYDSQYGKRAT